MLNAFNRLCLTFLLLLSFSVYAVTPISEIEFIKEFSGKDADYILAKLGEPYKKISKENAGGTVEFWLYQNLVNQGSSEKVFKFTQIGIVNNYVETLGNTNIAPK
jgi:hypothetical protein